MCAGHCGRFSMGNMILLMVAGSNPTISSLMVFPWGHGTCVQLQRFDCQGTWGAHSDTHLAHAHGRVRWLYMAMTMRANSVSGWKSDRAFQKFTFVQYHIHDCMSSILFFPLFIAFFTHYLPSAVATSLAEVRHPQTTHISQRMRISQLFQSFEISMVYAFQRFRTG